MRNKIEYSGHTFTTSDIKSVNIRLASSLISRQLEANTITAVVETDDESIQNFVRNTPMRYYYRERQRFLAYVQSVDRVGQRAYQIYGTSAIGLLMERMHVGGLYTGQTAEAVVREIVGNIPFAMKSALKGIKLYGWLPYAKPPDRSARDNLVQVLFAIGAAIKTDLDGVLRIEHLWDGISGTLEWGDIYEDGASARRTGAISSVSVTEHSYTTGGEDAKLFEGDAIAGDIITFSEPMYNLSSTGFSILERGANYAKLSAGTGTLTGKKYIHNTRQITRTVTAGAVENVKTVDDATLVSFFNSNSVADSLAEYYKHSEVIECSVVLDEQSPGDVLNVFHPYTKKAGPACLESLDISASGILKASMKALAGYRPPQTVEPVRAAKYTDPYAWSATTIGYILKRPEYTGRKVLGKTVCENYKTKSSRKTTPEEQYIFEGAIPAILDVETWQTVPHIFRSLESKPAKRWESIADKALWAVCAAVIAFLLGRVGL